MSTRLYLWGLALALASVPAIAEDPDRLYKRGLQAYGSGDYLAASEHLFAYREIVGDKLPADFSRQVNDALSYAEAQVEVALETKRELDKHGKVTKVTVESSGKADRPGEARSRTERFRAPPGVNRRKPRLPGKPSDVDVDVGDAARPKPKLAVPMERAVPRPSNQAAHLRLELERLKRKYAALRKELHRCRMANRR